jgi:hypothetical protein
MHSTAVRHLKCLHIVYGSLNRVKYFKEAKGGRRRVETIMYDLTHKHVNIQNYLKLTLDYGNAYNYQNESSVPRTEYVEGMGFTEVKIRDVGFEDGNLMKLPQDRDEWWNVALAMLNFVGWRMETIR